MTPTDERARRAGEDLRDWRPAVPHEEPAAAIAVARRRRRSRRLVAGGVAAAALAVTGLWLGASQHGPQVETGPAGRTGGPTTTESGAAPSTAPSTAVPDTSPSTTESTESTATTVPAPPPSTEPPPPVAPTSCGAPLAGGGSYVVSIPDGWYANEEFEGERACTYFGPEPIVFRDYVEDWGWASNADVHLNPSPVSGLPGAESWEDYLASKESHVAPPEAQRERISTERRTVAGQPALREEFLEEGGRRWVRWSALLGDTVVIASAGEESPAGLSYEEQVAALDAIVTTIRFER